MKIGFIALLLGGLLACGGGGGGTPPASGTASTPTVSAPTNLKYPVTSANYQVGVAISSNTPTYSGGAPTSYAVSPALPAGLNFNTSNGTISGTPSAASSGSYHVTASNSGGSTSTDISISVTNPVTTPPPTSISYTVATLTSADPGKYTTAPVALFTWVGTAMLPKTPTVTGGSATSYSVSPALPNGLTLDPVTGVLSGTPTVQMDTTDYTFTATNSGGSASVKMPITVNAALPQFISVPDVGFQNALISMNIPVTNGQVKVSDAATVTKLHLNGGIQNLAGIEAFVNLTTLEILNCQIPTLDLSNNGNLNWLTVGSDEALTSLDVSKLVNLQLLGIQFTGLKSIDLSKNISLLELDVYNDQDDPSTPWGVTKGLTSLDVSHNTNLWRLYCGFNLITSLDVSHNPQLSEVWAENNQLTAMDFTHNPQMYVIVLYNNNLTSLNIKGCGVPRTCTTFYPTANPPISSGLSNKNQNLFQIQVDNVAAVQAWANLYPVWWSQGPQTIYVQ